EKAVTSSSMDCRGLSRSWEETEKEKKELTQRAQRNGHRVRREERKGKEKPAPPKSHPERKRRALDPKGAAPAQQPMSAHSTEQSLRGQGKRVREKGQFMGSDAGR